MQYGSVFTSVARKAAHIVGSGTAFVLAVVLIIVWAVLGPLFGFSDTWQLVINTSITIITFLIVFVIQNTQNRDSLSMELKLDELLRAVSKARTGLVNLEELSEDELKQLQSEFERLRKRTAKTANEKQVKPIRRKNETAPG